MDVTDDLTYKITERASKLDATQDFRLGPAPDRVDPPRPRKERGRSTSGLRNQKGQH